MDNNSNMLGYTTQSIVVHTNHAELENNEEGDGVEVKIEIYGVNSIWVVTVCERVQIKQLRGECRVRDTERDTNIENKENRDNQNHWITKQHTHSNPADFERRKKLDRNIEICSSPRIFIRFDFYAGASKTRLHVMLLMIIMKFVAKATQNQSD